MTTPQFFSASQLSVYAGDIGATADEFVAATGALVIDPAVWDTAGLGPFNNGVHLGRVGRTNLPDVPGEPWAWKTRPGSPCRAS